MRRAIECAVCGKPEADHWVEESDGTGFVNYCLWPVVEISAA